MARSAASYAVRRASCTNGALLLLLENGIGSIWGNDFKTAATDQSICCPFKELSH